MATMLQISDFEDSDYDPFATDAVNFGEHLDPYPQIARWRAEIAGSFAAPIAPLMGIPYAMMPDREGFTVVGTREVAAALADPETFSNGAYEFTIGATFGHSLSVMDNPGAWPVPPHLPEDFPAASRQALGRDDRRSDRPSPDGRFHRSRRSRPRPGIHHPLSVRGDLPAAGLAARGHRRVPADRHRPDRLFPCRQGDRGGSPARGLFQAADRCAPGKSGRRSRQSARADRGRWRLSAARRC